MTVLAGAIAVGSFATFFWPERPGTLGDTSSIGSRLGIPVGAASAGPPAGGSDTEVEIESVAPPTSESITAAPVQPVPLLRPNAPWEPAAKVAPVGLAIGGLGIDAHVTPAGVDRATGQMAVPDNVDDVAWYEYGPTPGDPGSAVLAAHVDLESQGPGVFFELRSLEPGDIVTVSYEDGTQRRFTVEARVIYDKSELPLDAIFAREGDPVLTLITCGGDFNWTERSYDANVVVYAVPESERDQLLAGYR